MIIVTASDDGFLPQLGVLLHSAWLYHPEARFYLLDAGISESNRDLLRRYAGERAMDLHIIPCGDILKARLPMMSNLGTYARWLVPELLPETLDRVIYLDADIAVIDTLDELYASDLANYPVAAVEDGNADVLRIESESHGTIFDHYFNAGVMVMNLRQWRSEGIAAQVFAFAAANPHKLPLSDQSALNVVLHGRSRKLDQTWNFFKAHEIETLPRLPRVVHFVSATRPDRWAESPFAELYKFHRDQTPWPFAGLSARRWTDLRRRLGAALRVARYKRRAEEKRLIGVTRATVAIPALLRAQAKQAALMGLGSP
ncbi:MAG TPA: glycosyltransferase family 8 protein [Afipia sp.]